MASTESYISNFTQFLVARILGGVTHQFLQLYHHLLQTQQPLFAPHKIQFTAFLNVIKILSHLKTPHNQNHPDTA